MTLKSTFDWKTQTLTWYAERADTLLAPVTVIRRLAASLESRGAIAEVSPQQDSLTFRAKWRSQRSWIACFREGKGQVTVRDGRLVVVVSGRVAWRVLLMPFYLSILPLLIARPFALFAFVFFTFIASVNYLIAYHGMRGVAKAALSFD